MTEKWQPARGRRLPATTRLTGICQQRRVVVRSVDIQGYERIVHGNILDVVLIAVLNVARAGGCGGLQKTLQSIRAPPDTDAHAFRNAPVPPPKYSAGAASNASRSSWTVTAAIGGRSTSVIIAASRPWLSTSCSPDLQGTELSAAGVGIYNNRGPVSVGNRRQLCLVIPRDHDHEVGGGRQRSNRCGQGKYIFRRWLCPAICGGQGSKALSVPMREDSPAARITPAKLGARDMCGR